MSTPHMHSLATFTQATWSSVQMMLLMHGTDVHAHGMTWYIVVGLQLPLELTSLALQCCSCCAASLALDLSRTHAKRSTRQSSLSM